jgi:hypothetical protein
MTLRFAATGGEPYPPFHGEKPTPLAPAFS